MLPDPAALTADRYDLQFGVNFIGQYAFHSAPLPNPEPYTGHWFFTQLLIPQLTAAGSSRVVNVSSHGHVLVDGINWDSARDGSARQKMKSLDLYNQSKFVRRMVLLLV